MVTTKLLVFLSCAFYVKGELIVNGDFEDPLTGAWICNGCTLERSLESFGGSYSGQISNRVASWGGPVQYVYPQIGSSYKFIAKIKLENQDEDKLWHEVQITTHIIYPSGEEAYPNLGRNPQTRLDDGWITIGGDYTFDTAYETVSIYLQIPEANINYLLDDVSMDLITPSDLWEEEANRRISELRKSDVTFSILSDDPDNVELQFELVKHSFPFGTAVKAALISDETDPKYQKYQLFFYENFNYAVLENALKWDLMEQVEGEINYALPESAIIILNEANIPVRGHCVFWGVEGHVPEWVRSGTSEEVESDVTDRIDGVVGRFAGRLAHWDVNNERLHGTWFEEATNNPDYLSQMFTDIHQVDSDVHLFLNDFHIVTVSDLTMAMKEFAVKLLSDDTPLHGIGIQSHIIGDVNPPIHVLKSRLDTVAQAGLPLWITELDVPDENVTNRADRYEDLWRLYFSHPAINGILIWGFWDQAHHCPQCALAEGDDVIPNEAGLRWQSLLFDEWSTNVTLSTSIGLDVRAFHGDYTLRVLYNDQLVQTQYLTVVNGENNFEIVV